MSITSFYFLVLVLAGVILYYLVPKKVRWLELLLVSLVFYWFAAQPITIIYIIVSTLIAYGSTMWMASIREKKQEKPKKLLALTWVAIISNLLLWLVVKGRGLWGMPWDALVSKMAAQGTRLPSLQFVAALGMGYYTLQMVGYIIDCYWESITPQKNPLKLFLFATYFPQMITGPISRYEQMESLFTGNSFSYRNITFGAQRVLWGFVKKIVLAERLGIVINTIANNLAADKGFYSWVLILVYPIQMYADFSGCMDIVLGVSEMFGVRLAENFRNPFFARSSQEFWQRWHITLGTWAKDYVLYPLLKTKRMVNFGKFTKKKFGKKTGKFLVNVVGMFLLWMVMGIWHGGYKYIVGVSLWYWIILMSGELLAPYFEKITQKLQMKTESFSWHLFQSARTYLIYAVGATFFCVGVKDGLMVLWDALKVFFVKDYANPWIFFDGSFLQMGLTLADLNVILVCVLLLFVVGALRERFEYARNFIAEQSFLFRWAIWIGLFILVIIFGKYGPGYNATDFIYQGF